VVAEEGPRHAVLGEVAEHDLDGVANLLTDGDALLERLGQSGALPVEEYLHVTPRFMSEYGLQAWPEMRTLGLSPSRRSMSHQLRRHAGAPEVMAGRGQRTAPVLCPPNFGEPRDFEDFVYLSQVMQAEGIELAALHHRASRPHTMGSLYWQLNDVWPGASWSSVDSYGRWKALQPVE
jgi:beta-mannosidase